MTPLNVELGASASSSASSSAGAGDFILSGGKRDSTLGVVIAVAAAAVAFLIFRK